MSQKTKQKYLTKSTSFGNKKLTLYSLDGLTWSSRCDELEVIRERHEAQRITFAQIKGTVKPEEADDKEKAKESTNDGGPQELIAELDDDVAVVPQPASKKHAVEAPARQTSVASKKVVPIGRKAASATKKPAVTKGAKKPRIASKSSKRQVQGRSRRAA